jgi:ankyrin repeat protein
VSNTHFTGSLPAIDAVQALRNGDFSRLAPYCDRDSTSQCIPLLEWHASGSLDAEPSLAAEALTCACFNGAVDAAAALLDRGVVPSAGDATGLDALHWAVNRGRLEVVTLLLARGVDVEQRNMHDATALGTAVWSAIHEPRSTHAPIIRALLAAGANAGAVSVPSGSAEVDELIVAHRADETTGPS